MLLLIVGLILFIGIHLLPVFSRVRTALAEKTGTNGYRGVFSIVALIGLVLIVWGYGQAHETGVVVLYETPHFFRHITHLLMIPVFILLVSAYAHGRITEKVRHPMIAAVKIWAFAHLLPNGDLASVILFGCFLAWAVVARISMSRREKAGAVTVKSGPVQNDLVAVCVGLAIYLAFMFKAHSWLIGVPVL